MVELRAVFLRKILNSRAEQTLEAEIITDRGRGIGRAPSGKSKGEKEAVSLPVNKAFDAFRRIKDRLLESEFNSPEEFDDLLLQLCGENKENCGGNLTIALSIAFWRAWGLEDALSRFFEKDFPVPMFNVINGGLHAGVTYSIQEFLLVPLGIKPFPERIFSVADLYITLKEELKKRFGKAAVNVGDEGGFALPVKSSREVLELLEDVTYRNYTRREIAVSLDIAASSFYRNGSYFFDGKVLQPAEYVEAITELLNSFKVFTAEDPAAETDVNGFKEIKKRFSGKIVADDLTATHPEFIQRYAELFDGVIIKPDQIGTVKETLEAILTARRLGKFCICSHRSGDTTDTFVAELAFYSGSRFIKAGAPARGERTAKYNWLLRKYYSLGEVV